MPAESFSRRKYLKLLLPAAGLWPLGGLAFPLPAASVIQTEKFGLPFAVPPGLSTWYVRQWYGNTRWAYRQRRALYSAGQGMHFGVDLFAPCSLAVVAIGSGTVIALDGPYGALPHNVLVRHPNGLVSLYGHLLNRSNLRVGQAVRQGDQLGMCGAPSGADCDTHPHLHLEIRQSNLAGTVNPLPLIEADWANLTLGTAGEGLQFQLDLDQPGRWQTIFDQPAVRFGGALLNDYARSWP